MTSSPSRSREPWSFAANLRQVADRRAEANRLAGEEVRRVTYLTIDYRALGEPGGAPGPRLADPSEPAEDLWDFGTAHSVDFGVEIETATGRIFGVTWDLPGEREGVGLREARLTGSAVRADAEVAVWDVSASPLWAPLLGRRVDAVALDYRPWSDAGDWWCPVLTITSAGSGVVLGLGDVGRDGVLEPSADNVLVLAYPSNVRFPIPSTTPQSGSLDV